MTKLSFSLSNTPGVSAVFAEWAMPERLAHAREMGFRGIEAGIPENPAALRAALDALGMTFVCLSCARGEQQRDELGLAGLPDRRSDFRDEFERAIEIATALGCTRLHPLAGLLPQGSQRERCEDVYAENLAHACRQAAKVGMQVLIEPICALRQPRFLLHTAAQALELMERIAAPNLLLQLDMFHAAAAGESVPQIAASHARSVGLLQVAHGSSRCEPPEDDPTLAATLAALAQSHWDGWIGAEYIPSSTSEESLYWTRKLRR
jgi:hydroxypyruvate isomerase